MKYILLIQGPVQKQATGQIWPKDHSYPTPALRDVGAHRFECRVKDRLYTVYLCDHAYFMYCHYPASERCLGALLIGMLVNEPL